MNQRLAALALAIAATHVPLAAKPSTTFDDAVRQALQANGVASVSFAQVENGKVVRVAAYGLQSPGVPASPATLYNIASLTKPLTAEVVLRLASAGKLSLDEPMDNAFVDPDIAKDPRHSRLTARLALTHQTGLPNWRAPGGLAFDHDPGTRWSYSGEGFQYAARFAESRMKQPLDKLAVAYVFKPLGMQHSSYIGQPWYKGRIALPTDAAGKWLEPSIPAKANAADLVYTTPRDYARFMLAVLRDTGLSPALAEQRSASQVSLMDIACSGKHADSCPPHVGFGLGWQLMQFRTGPVLMHTGKDEGLFTFVYLDRARRNGTVIFTNSDVGFKMVLPILELTRTDPEFLRFLRGQMD